MPVHAKPNEFHGYRFIYDEAGASFYQKKTETGWLLMRLLPSDFDPKNLALMAKLKLTNTNKAPKLKVAK